MVGPRGISEGRSQPKGLTRQEGKRGRRLTQNPLRKQGGQHFKPKKPSLTASPPPNASPPTSEVTSPPPSLSTGKNPLSRLIKRWRTKKAAPQEQPPPESKTESAPAPHPTPTPLTRSETRVTASSAHTETEPLQEHRKNHDDSALPDHRAEARKRAMQGASFKPDMPSTKTTEQSPAPTETVATPPIPAPIAQDATFKPITRPAPSMQRESPYRQTASTTAHIAAPSMQRRSPYRQTATTTSNAASSQPTTPRTSPFDARRAEAGKIQDEQRLKDKEAQSLFAELGGIGDIAEEMLAENEKEKGTQAQKETRRQASQLFSELGGAGNIAEENAKESTLSDRDNISAPKGWIHRLRKNIGAAAKKIKPIRQLLESKSRIQSQIALTNHPDRETLTDQKFDKILKNLKDTNNKNIHEKLNLGKIRVRVTSEQYRKSLKALGKDATEGIFVPEGQAKAQEKKAEAEKAKTEKKAEQQTKDSINQKLKNALENADNNSTNALENHLETIKGLEEKGAKNSTEYAEAIEVLKILTKKVTEEE